MATTGSVHTQKVAIVTNATSKNQGRNAVKELSEAGYIIKALTRNPASADALALTEYKNVKLVQCDPDNIEQLYSAFAGGHVLIANSIPDFQEVSAPARSGYKSTQLSEFEQGKRYADAAKSAGIKIIVWATLPDANKISNGKYSTIKHFQEKVKVQEYMVKHDLPAVFLSPSFFMENITHHHMITAEGDKLVYTTPRATIDTGNFYQVYMSADWGRMVRLVLEKYDTLQLKHKVICVSNNATTLHDIVETVSNVTGKKVEVKTTASMMAEGSDFDEMVKYYVDPAKYMYEEADWKFTKEFLAITGFEMHSFHAFASDKLKPMFT